MEKDPKYFIVEISALPDVFVKVVEAKRLLATGGATTVNDAARQVGISRSAFYKYRDLVQPFQNMRRVLTFQFMLRDEPGILSSVLACFAQWEANILTVNSITPSNGCAVVTISANAADMTVSLDSLLDRLRELTGVVRADVLAG